MVKKLLHYLNLDSEIESFNKIHATIEQGIEFKGTNLWILVFAIVVASVGLNMNSTAVIIGAMLISPLMGPINGMGYGIATYDYSLFRKAVKNFTFAVIASLTASTLYFAISPVSTAYSELLARTSPTIYDVLIALFGGLAGIVAISSTQKGNVIPGVAIATALMPPLCTAGYGLGTGQFTYFFGALYLFTINTVFIAISSVAISQILRFPIKTLVKDDDKKKVNRTISLVTLVTIIPSIYFGYGLVQKEKFTGNATRFTKSVSVFEGSFLLNSDVNPGNRTIRLVYGGNSLTDSHKNVIQSRAKDFSLTDAEVTIEQGFSLSDLNGSANEIDKLRNEINRLLAEQGKQRDSLTHKALLGKSLLSEIRTLYPQITSCSYSEAPVFSDTVDTPEKGALVFFSTTRALKTSDQEKIKSWLQSRLNFERARVFFQVSAQQ
jgi:uncharacterized hydrophobic protein (TIGR00271 family)